MILIGRAWAGERRRAHAMRYATLRCATTLTGTP